MPASSDSDRKRGRIEQRGDTLRVAVYAGIDPVTGKRSYLREAIKGTDRAARKKANSKLGEFIAEVDKRRSVASSVTLSHTIEEWLRTAELEGDTREMYRGYFQRNIKPTLGDISIRKLTARNLEKLYSELRRCRARCDGTPRLDCKKSTPHDCESAGCPPHKCVPLAASTVRQIHAVMSGALSAAVRWEWIDTNPARVALRPKQTPPRPDPPTAAEAAHIAEAAFAMDDEWGTLVWLAMTTGMRRGELCALHWSDIDLDGEILNVSRNYIQRNGISKEKDTKTHQMRRIALDSETLALLREHRQHMIQRCADLGVKFHNELYVFTSVRQPSPTHPAHPDTVSGRYKRMVDKLGINTHIHALRHYSATELLTAGIDLRTVAGRLGHGGGGATTLRVYAAWVAGADRKAAEILGSRMPKRARSKGRI